MQDKNNAFNNALSNFTFGMANRDLICHMATEGYSVRQIKTATDYPVTVEKIAETVWEHYIETGVIRLTPPGSDEPVRYDYVMDIGKFGKRSFRRVERKPDVTGTSEAGLPADKGSGTSSDNNKNNYIPCDFGILKKHDPSRYQAILDTLDSRKRDYIEGLPWPDQTVWHVDNLMMREIRDILTENDLWNN